MLPDTLARDPVALARFQREMRALASCDHPNIMKVLTNGTMPDGRLYYTMEYVPGADLEQIWSELAGQTGTASAARLGSTTLARAVHTASDKQRQTTTSRYRSGAPAGATPSSGQSVPPATESHDKTSEVDPRIPRLPLPPLPPLPSKTEDPGSYVRSIVTLMRDVALALQAVHDQGILHRDVKPANLMLTPDGSRIVLMDFGLAKGQDTTLAASNQGGLLGTLRYAAPEQLAYPRVEISPATDVYGLGVTMWELLTRHRLFQDAEDEKQLAMLMHDSDVPSVRTVDPSLDRDLDAIVARATERRMSDRIKTAGQLAAYLQLYLDGKPLPFLQPSLPEKCWRWMRRHKRAVAAGVAGVMLLSAMATGVWYWDAYQRAHVEYYAQVITRWGLPEGVGHLTAEQMRQRNASLEFHRHGRHGPVHEIRLVNSRGAYPPEFAYTGIPKLSSLNPLSQETVDDVSETSATSRVVFERDARGQILNQSAYNRAGRRIYTLHYVQPNMAEYKDEGVTRVIRESGIALLKFVRSESGPEAGLDQEVRYFDGAGKPQPDRSGAYGFRFIFNTRGLQVKEIVLGAEGQPGVTKAGIATATITHDALGNPTQIALFGLNGRSIVNAAGVAGTKRVYDQYGNLQELAFVGTEDQLVIVKALGAAGRSFRYDAHGNLVEGTFFDLNRQLVGGSLGFARQTIEWDEHGRSLETAFGPDGKPIVFGDRVVKLRGVWDTRGYLVETSFFDEHERLIRNNGGCAKLRFTHDVHGSLIKQTCLDERDDPIRSTGGSAHLQWIRDDRGNAVETLALSPMGQPELYDEIHVKVRRKYNPQGKPVEVAHFDATDQLVKNKEGYAKITYTYDLQGNLTEVAFFDAQHQPTARQGGYAKILRTYDAYDRLIEETLRDP
jgi:YD repeat-containing protein